MYVHVAATIQMQKGTVHMFNKTIITWPPLWRANTIDGAFRTLLRKKTTHCCSYHKPNYEYRKASKINLMAFNCPLSLADISAFHFDPVDYEQNAWIQNLNKRKTQYTRPKWDLNGRFLLLKAREVFIGCYIFHMNELPCNLSMPIHSNLRTSNTWIHLQST